MEWRIFVSHPMIPFSVYDPLKAEGCKLILGFAPSYPMVRTKKKYSEEEAIEKTKDVDVIICGAGLPITSRVLSSAERLIGICQNGIGFDNIDIKAASKYGIIVTNTPLESIFLNVAEHTVALILALAKKFKVSLRLLENLGGDAYYEEEISTTLLNQKTIGLIGFGRIGSKVAALLAPFGVKLLVYDPFVSDNLVEKIGAQKVNLQTLLKESDFVSVQVPLTPETRYMISAKELALMKPTAYLINTARGAIIDENSLVNALKDGKIAGAGLDVLEREPLSPDNPLLKMNNVIITPHNAGRGSESMIHGEKVAVNCCLRILKGDIPEYVVNPEAIQKWKERISALMRGFLM